MKQLNEWFEENKRSFPWREEISPYRVWVSEVMLQQTRAQVVIPYFDRWMKAFPDIPTLASAPLEEVIKRWEGLGYYSRARNLHAGARQVMDQFGGTLPSSREELLQIKGLGPYTSAAILAFGFRRPFAPVDGNVLRVLTRYFGIEEDIGKSSTRTRIEKLAEELLDEREPWVTAEALIELGALVCTPKPICSSCPLQSECKAALHNRTEELPIKKAPPNIKKLMRGVAIIESNGEVLVKKNPPGEIMADLYEFPYFDGLLTPFSLKKALVKNFSIPTEGMEKQPIVSHSFTQYRVSLFPVVFLAREKKIVSGWEWIPIQRLPHLPFSSGHRKVLSARCNYWRSCGLLLDYEYSSS